VSEQVELTGRLLRDQVAPGSKSERTAVVIEADDGQTYFVRRRGAPAWGEDDPNLAALVGRRVRVVGSVIAGTVLADEAELLDDTGAGGESSGGVADLDDA
jgi:hypothetical protein